MSEKSIFKASFEESLNLEDDGFRKLQQGQHDKTEQFFKGGKVSLWFRIRCLILTIIFPICLNALIVIISMIFHDSKTLTIPISSVSLLTANTYLILLLIWLLFVLIGKFFKPIFIRTYRYQFHVFTFMNLFYIELDLAFTEFLLPAASIWGVIAFYGLIGVVGYIMLSIERRSCRKLLFDETNAPRLIDKIANKIAAYGTGVLGIAVIINFILKAGSIKFSTSISAFGFLLLWIVLNIIGLAINVFIGFPYFLQAYYKWKYPEEYREWEGKPLEEWYGKRYLKKHPELLEKDDYNQTYGHKEDTI